tara:strand:+ start:355 stop:1110 length:756 start_codon:yes stop_codon:yes gene_type:complete
MSKEQIKRVIIVTGGLGIIGRTFVEQLIENGYVVICADIQCDSSKDNNINLLNVNVDITSKTSIDKMIQTVIEKYGRIDGLINNAYPKNQHYGKRLEDIEYDGFCENVGMNLGGYCLMIQRLLPTFIKQGHGNIINVSSIYGVVSPKFELYENTSLRPTPVEYVAIKSALIHLTKFFAKYFKGKNIRVNSISPGGINSGQDQSFVGNYEKNCLNKGMLESKDLVGAVLFLLSKQSEYINGQNIIIDDGFSL